jgi:hypothetical protein
VQDFPQDVLQKYDLTIRDPDAFLRQLLAVDERAFIRSVRVIRSRLGNPPSSTDNYLEILSQQGLPATVTALRSLIHRL